MAQEPAAVVGEKKQMETDMKLNAFLSAGKVLIAAASLVATAAMALYANLPFLVGPGIGGSVLVGVTLANSFPSMAFRPSAGRRWDEGVVIGLSGEGVQPISNLTLAKVAGMGITVSGNGGAVSYRDAANFLALGAGTVMVR